MSNIIEYKNGIHILSEDNIFEVEDVLVNSFNWGSMSDNEFDKYNYELKSDEYLTLGYYIDDQMIGVLHSRILENKIHIEMLGIKKPFQKNGFGTELINQIINISKNKYNFDTTSIVCTEDTKKYYEKFGYEVFHITDRLLTKNKIFKIYNMIRKEKYKQIVNTK